MPINIMIVMIRRKNNRSEVALTPEEIEKATKSLLASAQAHQRASALCLDNPNAKPPDIDAFFMPLVSFELILLSVEQSLRVMVLMKRGIWKPGHDASAMYRELKDIDGNSSGVCVRILKRMNKLGSAKGIEFIDEKGLVACLIKHRSSYSDLRYFGIRRNGTDIGNWEIKPREVQIMHCLAAALIDINLVESLQRGVKVLSSMKPVPSSAMTEELTALRERLTSD